SVTKVRLDGPRGKSAGGLCVSTKVGTPFTGCLPPQPSVISYVRRPKMNAPLSANIRSTSSRLAPGAGRNSGSWHSSSPEAYQSNTCSPPFRPSGWALPSSGPATNPSRDIDISITTLLTVYLLHP